MKVYRTFCQYLFFLIGLWLMAWATVFAVQAQLGVGSWDVLHIGLSQYALTIGGWTILLGLLIVLFTYIQTKQIPAIGTVLNMLLCGIFIDIALALHWVPVAEDWWMQILWVLIGIVLLGFGAGMYISPRLGAGPRDAFTLLLAKRWNASIGLTRTLIEVAVVGIGWLLGGPVFIGTILFALLTGPVMQFALPRCEKALHKLQRIHRSTSSKVIEKAG